MSRKRGLPEDAVFELMSYLVTSAQGLLNEPAVYGSLRLVDAAGRLAGLAIEGTPGETKDFLKELQGEIDESKELVMLDPEAYAAFLEDTVRRVARELKRRSAQPG